MITSITGSTNVAVLPMESNPVRRFAELVAAGIESWVQAGKIVVEQIEVNPRFVDEVCDATGMSRAAVLSFERIGRGRLEPRLLMSSAPGPRRLIDLPIAEQVRYSSNPVPLLIRQNGSGWEVLQTKLENLTAEQARQVFARDHVRSEGEQRAWIEGMNRKADVKTRIVDEPYRISGKKLVILAPCQFTARQVADILTKMQ